MWPAFRLIHSYVYKDSIGVLVEFAVETDFAARTELFERFRSDISLQIAAMAPRDVGDLLAQPFVKQIEISVGDLLAQLAAQLRERVAVTRFVRWSVEDPVGAGPDPGGPDPGGRDPEKPDPGGAAALAQPARLRSVA